MDTLARGVVADLLEVNRVDRAGDFLLSPEAPRGLLKQEEERKSERMRPRHRSPGERLNARRALSG